jgi:hypothetical protein
MAVTTRTQADLAGDALRHLGLVGKGEPVDGEDSTYVVRRYLELMEELKDHRLAYWAANAIPINVYGAMTELLAIEIADSYGIMIGVQERETRARLARARLVRRISKEASGEPVQGSYF